MRPEKALRNGAENINSRRYMGEFGAAGNGACDAYPRPRALRHTGRSPGLMLPRHRPQQSSILRVSHSIPWSGVR